MLFFGGTSYMMDQKPNNIFDLGKLSDTPTEPLAESSNPVQDILDTTFRHTRATL